MTRLQTDENAASRSRAALGPRLIAIAALAAGFGIAAALTALALLAPTHPEPAKSAPASAARTIVSTATVPRPTPPQPTLRTAIAAQAVPLPFGIDGRFDLIDHHGRRRTSGGFDGKPVLLFFGYASCEAICTTALPRMADAARTLANAGIATTPVLVTVDPARDTPETMRTSLPAIHPALLGLTGSPNALAAARRAFQVEAKVVYTTPDGEEIYAHGNYIYLMAADGSFLTLFPPILSADRMATIAARYLQTPPT
ncbi:MAG: SCO family protein [Pseudomonadota bacterium]